MSYLIIQAFQKYSWVLLVLILVLGWFSPVLIIITFICMTAPIIFSFKYGRAWCGNFCPRSSFNNSVLSIISRGSNLPRLFKQPLFRFFIFIFLMSIFITSLIQTGGSWKGAGYALLRMMAFTTIIQICLGVFIQRNAWCMICPMGTAASFITWTKKQTDANIKRLEGCTDCGDCSKSCPIQIDIPAGIKNDKLLNPDCMKCRKCINSCPNEILYWDIK